jgi:hypothetical protein
MNLFSADVPSGAAPAAAGGGGGRNSKKKNKKYDSSDDEDCGCAIGGEMKKKCANPWMSFLAKFRAKHKGQYTATEMVKQASLVYNQ